MDIDKMLPAGRKKQLLRSTADNLCLIYFCSLRSVPSLYTMVENGGGGRIQAISQQKHFQSLLLSFHKTEEA